MLRYAFRELSGTMPEDLPVVESIKKIENKQRRQLGKADKLAKIKSEWSDMALHPNFSESLHAILDQSIRWFPADKAFCETSMDKLMPPLVPQLRNKVKDWRDSGYAGARDISKSLLNWWFNTQHLLPRIDGTIAGNINP
jgi:hypothetical protein